MSKTASRSIIFGEVESAGDGTRSEGDYGSDIKGEVMGDAGGGRDEGRASMDNTTGGGDIDSMRVDTALMAAEASQYEHPSTKAKY